MALIAEENLPISRRVVSREEAIRIYSELGDPYKLELVHDLPLDAVLSIYDQGEFFDLCRGPHLPSTGRIKAFKLLKRDHRKLGKEFGLFMFSEEAPGMPFFLPNGFVIRGELENFERELQTKKGYQEVRTPFIYNQRLWEQSGHWEHYHENIYITNVDEMWTQAESALRRMLEAKGIAYRTNEGDGAFYGPKIDFHILDALKRSWQCGTIQLDLQMPEKFDLHYVGQNNVQKRPVVIHRALYGSIDRFIGILTGHFAGHFPTWLSPVQAKVLPVSPAFEAYAREVKEKLQLAGVRADADLRNEKLGYKIRQAQLEKIPYMLVCGEAEASSGTLSVRKRGQGDIGVQNVDALIMMIGADVASKAI